MNNSYSADELYYTRWLTDLLHEALNTHPKAQGGILLHQGTTVRYLHERILASPWTLLAD